MQQYCVLLQTSAAKRSSQPPKLLLLNHSHSIFNKHMLHRIYIVLFNIASHSHWAKTKTQHCKFAPLRIHITRSLHRSDPKLLWSKLVKQLHCTELRSIWCKHSVGLKSASSRNSKEHTNTRPTSPQTVMSRFCSTQNCKIKPEMNESTIDPFAAASETPNHNKKYWKWILNAKQRIFANQFDMKL